MTADERGRGERGWTRVRSRLLLEDRWIRVRADECVTPEGVTVSPYYVLEYPDWVSVVAITPRRELVVVEQYRHAAGMVCLEVPGGGIEPGEDPIAAARRELLEETGFVAERGEILATLSPNPATHNNRVHTVLLTGAVPHSAAKDDPTERTVVSLMTLPEAEERAARGAFFQAMHVAALFTAFRRLDVPALG